MTQPILVFDLDGTLVDTAPDLLDSLNHCLADAGLRAAEPVELRRYIGMGARVMIERAFAAQRRALDEHTLEELFEIFLDHYTNGIPGRSALYPGLAEAMVRFEASGFGLAICTNKLERLATALIRALGLRERFRAICGADTFAFRKPDPRHLVETIGLAGGDPARAIMIGDSRTDIDTAKAAGIPVIAVDFGYTDRHVREFSPSGIISHYDELTLAMANDLLKAAAG